MLKLYENIREKRIQKGWSQTVLANKIGYSDKSMIAKIESGKVDINQTRILQFAKIFGCTPSELMGWEEEENDYIVKLDDGTMIELETNPFIDFGLTTEQEKKVLEYIKLIKKAEGSNI